VLEDSSYFKSSCLQEGNIWNPVKCILETSQTLSLLDTVNEVIFLTVIGRKKAFSFQGASPPSNPLTRGSAPEPRWGLRPQTPVIGSRSARSPYVRASYFKP